MSSKKPKKLLYLSAKYPEGYTSNLEDDLIQAYTNLPNIEHRVIELSDKTYTGLFYEKTHSGFALQFATSVPGEPASILPSRDNLSTPSAEMSTTPPPHGNDFSDGDAICLVSGNHVFTCLSKAVYTSITTYLRKIFMLAEMEKAAEVEVVKMANYDKIRLIEQKRIKSIQADVFLAHYEYDRLSRSDKEGIGRKLAHAFWASDRSHAEAAARANMKMRVKFSGKKAEMGEDTTWLSDMGKTVIECDDAYRIELFDGTVITPDDIRVSKTVRMEPNGKSVFVHDAIQKLTEFKESLLS